jgi:copper chaperone NosL
MMARVVMFVAFALSAACGVAAEGPPDIQVDRTACSHCGMLISEPVYAAGYRAADAAPRVFDDIGCLLEAARKERHPDTLRVWFHDAATAVWIDGGDAVFVGSPELRTPMGGGLIAYRDAAAAREQATRHRGRVINSWSDLLQAGETGGPREPRQAR